MEEQAKTPETPKASEAKPFELKLDEVKVNLELRERGGKLKVVHFFKPPAFEDWRAYFDALQFTNERDDKDFHRWDDHRDEAAAILWERIVLRVEGYWPDTPDNWKQRVPDDHKVHATGVFADVVQVDDDEGRPGTFVESEFTVRLAARRGAEYHERLVHRFRRPKAADRSRWKRAHAGAYHQREGKVERSVMPSRLPAQVAFYDEFVLGVSGYALDGQGELARDELLREMDAYHKSVAVRGLFNT